MGCDPNNSSEIIHNPFQTLGERKVFGRGLPKTVSPETGPKECPPMPRTTGSHLRDVKIGSLNLIEIWVQFQRCNSKLESRGDSSTTFRGLVAKYRPIVQASTMPCYAFFFYILKGFQALLYLGYRGDTLFLILDRML